MGSKFSKWKDNRKATKWKKRSGKNTLRNVGSTQSLNLIGNGSVSTNPHLRTPRNAGSTQSLNIIGNGSVSANQGPNVYSQTEVTSTPLWTQSVKAPPVVKRRSKTPETQTIAVSVQEENNKCVRGSERTSDQRPNTVCDCSGSICHSPNLGPYCCHCESKNKDDLSFKKDNIMQLGNDDLYCGGILPSSPYSFRQTDKHIRGRSACSACSASSVSSRSICASSASDFKICRRALSGPSVVDQNTLYCSGKLPFSSYSYTQTDKHICLRSACSASSVSSRPISVCASSASDLKSSRRASSGLSGVDHDTESDGWYFVKFCAPGQEGPMPTNCVENITSVNVESQKYFFRLSKKKAEEKLQGPEIEIGTYLLRRHEGKGAYVLSLRCENEIYELHIKHYKIRVDDKGVCYIDDDSIIKIKPFSNIMELITYYTEEPGLRCKLKTPLPQDILLDDLAVKFSDFTLEERIGYGNYGTVYAGTLYGKKQVAVKSLRDGGSMTLEEFREEAETMHKLRHPNLVSLLAICECDGTCKIHIITERMSKGALLDLLREDTHLTIKFTDLMHMAIQVAEGMCYLEEKGFVHRDLRAANVLVGDGNIAKIADFGLARLLDTYYANENFYEEIKGKVFPYKWTAPEAIKKKKFSVKSDVWSFGILLYEMVTHGDEPYAAMNNAEVLDWVEKGNRLRRPSEYYCSLALYNVMLQCWLKNSNERPNFECIKENLIEIKAKE